MNRTGGYHPFFNGQTPPAAMTRPMAESRGGRLSGGTWCTTSHNTTRSKDAGSFRAMSSTGFRKNLTLAASPRKSRPILGGDVRSSHRGGGVSPAEPFGHRAFTAADFQYSARLRHPDLQAV